MSRGCLRLVPWVAAALVATEAPAAQRVFVASYGNDANTCSLAAPCRGFTRAMTQVDPGGEVIALDAAGYGSVVVTKSVTIATNPGFFAGVSVSTGHGIELNGDIDVVLRGLNINAIGGSALSGIHITNANSLTVENCIVAGFPLTGLNAVFSTQPTLRITDSTFRGNGIYGILVGGGAKATLHQVRLSANQSAGLHVLNSEVNGPATAVVTDSDSFGNGTGYSIEGGRLSLLDSSASGNVSGVNAGLGAFVAVARSSIVGNTYGFQNSASTFQSYANNLLRYNTLATEGTITVVEGQ